MADLHNELFADNQHGGQYAGGYGQPQQPQQQPAASGDWFASNTAPSSSYSQPYAPPSVPMYTNQGFAPPAFDNGGNMGGVGSGAPNFDDEPPLLDELGINFEHIYVKTMSVLIPTKEIDQHILDDTDLAGPLVFSFVQGMCLLLSRKLLFGYVFGLGVLGAIATHTVLNLMCQTKGIDMYKVVSVLGYCLLPIVMLSSLTIFVTVRGAMGYLLTLFAIIWCTHTATRFFEVVLGMREQRYLISYPVFLLYACFALITIF